MAGKIQNADIKSEAELVGLGADKTQLLNTTKMYSPKTTNVLENDLRKNNDAAIVAPAVTNDSSQGYEPGSRWVDTVGQKAYTCVSSSVGAAIWKAGGEGGIGGVDIVAAQTAEDAVLGDFTQVGLEIIDTPIILHGKKSFRLIHQAASTRSFKQIIPVDSKFRGKAVTFEVDVVSSALMANLTLLIYNETAAANIAASQQIQTDSQSITATTTSGTATLNGMTAADFNKLKLGMLITGPGIASGTRVDGLNASTLTATLSLNATSTSTSAKSISALTTKRKISFMIPEGCKSLSYTFSALQEANFPETYLDDIVIQLAQYALASTNINIPVQSPPTVTKILSGSGIYNVPANASYIRVRMVGAGGGGGGNSNNGGNLKYAGATGGNTTFADMIAYGGQGGQGAVAPAGLGGSGVLGAIAKGSIIPGGAGQTSSGYNANGSSMGGSGGSSMLGGGAPGPNESAAGTNALANTGGGGSGASGVGFTAYNYGASGGGAGGGIDAVILSPASSYSYSVGTGGNGAGGSNYNGGNGGSGYIEITEYITTNTTSKVDLTSAMLVQQPDSYLRLAAAGTTALVGSTANKIISFTNCSIQDNVGNDIQYLDDSVNGARFIAKKEGIFHFTFATDLSVSAGYIGFSKNSVNLTTSIEDLPVSERLVFSYDGSASDLSFITCEAYLKVDDIVRVHKGAAAINTATAGINMIVSSQGSMKQLNLSSDSKIEIPTHELRFEGSSSRGSTDTHVVKFDAITKLKGDAYEVLNTAANGTVITMKKAGRLNINTNIYVAFNTNQTLTLNANTLNSFVRDSSVLSEVVGGPGSLGSQLSAQVDVKIGDKIRVISTVNPNSLPTNSLSLSLMETQINAAFSNILPQWSESDSSIMVNTPVGYGSVNNKIRRFANLTSNFGSAITYVDSATLGASFTINENGIYHISYSDDVGANSAIVAITKNASLLTSGPDALPMSEKLASVQNGSATFQDNIHCSWSGYLQKGDVIRPHTSGAVEATAIRTFFTITKIGKPNLTSVDVSPFVNMKTREDITFRANGVPQTSYTINTPVVFSGVVEDPGKLYNTTTGQYTSPISGNMTVSYYINTNVAINTESFVYVNGVARVRAGITYSNVGYLWGSTTIKVLKGDLIDIRAGNPWSAVGGGNSLTISYQKDNDSIATPTQNISSDTIPFVFKAAVIDPNTDPVGTYNTYSKQSNIGASLILNGTAPTQTSASMNANGLLVYSANITGTTSAAQPSRFDVFIGKGLKSKQVDAYAATGKIQALMTDYINNQSGTFYGTKIVYNETNGILTIDSDCISGNATATRSVGLGIDGIGYTSGYFVFNASKSPSLVTIPNFIQPVLGVRQSALVSIPGGVLWTKRNFDTVDKDNKGWWNANRYTPQAAGTYQITYCDTINSTGINFMQVAIYKNGVLHSKASNYLPANTYDISQTVSAQISMNGTTDYLEFYIAQSGVAAMNAPAGYGFASIVKLFT